MPYSNLCLYIREVTVVGISAIFWIRLLDDVSLKKKKKKSVGLCIVLFGLFSNISTQFLVFSERVILFNPL